MAKVCVISGDFPPKARGTGYSAYKITKYLKQKYHHEMVVITRTMVQTDDINIKNEIVRPFFQRDYYEPSRLGKIYRVVVPKIPIFQIFANKIKITKILHLEQPDVVIVVTPGIYSLPRDSPEYIIKNGGAVYVYNVHRKFDSAYSAYIKIFGTLLFFLERKLFQKAQKIISVSSFETRVLNQIYNIPNDRTIRILNGIDKLVPNPAILNRKKLKRILYVGQLNDIKGVTYLFEAFHEIASEFPTLSLDIVGEGAFQKDLEKFIRINHLKERILMHGYLPQVKVHQYLEEADLAIVPSIHDACPNTVLEAFGHCVPVIGSRVGGIPELVEHKKSGLLVQPKSGKAIAEAIRLLMNNPGLYREMIEYLVKAREQISWFRRIDGFQQEIEKILEKKTH